MLRRYTLIALIFICITACAGTTDTVFSKIGVSVDYYLGKHIKHSPKIIADLPGLTHGVEISCFKQTSGEKDWQRKLLYPETGGAIYIIPNVNPKVFGTTIGLMGTVKLRFVRTKYVDFYTRFGCGIAFLTKHYHINRNPENNVIGSTLNATFQLKVGADFKPLPWLHLSLAGFIVHQSNGGIQQPNLGINVAGMALGLRYFPAYKPRSYIRGKVPKMFKPNEFMFRFGYGVTDWWRGGPKYPLYFATFAYARYTSIINKVIAGVTFEYNYAISDFMTQGEIGTRKEQRLHGFTPSVFIGDEIMINRVSMLYAAGVYLYHPSFRASWIYMKAGVNYYFVDLGKNGTIKPYIGAHLKFHRFVAQTIEFGTGFVFR